jgi:hypothetical protein
MITSRPMTQSVLLKTTGSTDAGSFRKKGLHLFWDFMTPLLGLGRRRPFPQLPDQRCYQ